MGEAEERTRVVAAARSWLGTPYHEHACVKGAGADCAMMPKAAFEEALGIKIDFQPYSSQWFLHRSEELYVNKILEHAHEIDEAQAKPGDMVVYKIGRCYAHGGIIVLPGWPRIVHAYKNVRSVIESDGSVGPMADDKGKPRPRRFFSRW